VYDGRIQSGGYEIKPDQSAMVLNASHFLYNFERSNNIQTNWDSYTNWCMRNNITGYKDEFKNIDENIVVPWGKNS
jgi:hypothetical protein